MMWLLVIVSQLVLGVTFLWTLNESMKPLPHVSPEKPAGMPPRDAVFLLPTGETWDIAESNAGGAS